MGLFDKPKVQDGTLKELIGIPVNILGIDTRDVDTMYGPGVALDVRVKVGDGEKLYSGFAAGILRQVRDAEEGDFPCWATIEDKPLRGGKSTLILVPSNESEAAQLTTDDDIPF